MNERVERELAMLRSFFSGLELGPDGLWVRFPVFPLPYGIWKTDEIEVCFQIPEQYPGQAPYAFYVRPDLLLENGSKAGNYEFPTNTGFGEGWGKFSWQLDPWTPSADPMTGSNLVGFVRSFSDRFREGK